MGSAATTLIFLLFLTVNTCINMDHGSIPAATNEISFDLGLSKMELGALGSLVFLGIAIGGIAAGICFQKLSPKFVLTIALFSICIFIALFPVSSNSIALVYLSRFMTGFFQVFLIAYIPAWIDIFASENQKTLWLTYLQLTVPFGMMFGYILTAAITEYWDWEYSFIIQGALFIPCAIILQFFPSSMIHYSEDALAKRQSESLLSLTHEKKKLKKKIYQLLTNPTYLWSICGIMTSYFVVTGAQFWTTDYLLNVLKIKGTSIFTPYAVTCLTAPTLGVAGGGYLCHRCGGYNGERAKKLCGLLGFLGCIFALPLPFVGSLEMFAMLFWFILFFGGGVMPVLTGIMISSVKNNMKPLASSFASVVTNLLGYLPAPIVYGIICEYTGGRKSPYGMMFIIYCCFISELFIILTALSKNKIIPKL
ncbi:unnamed protein product [Blepharisma stoltei]|uniref:Major facilitator superfamily (MFS) profile domain-containing protein n=1 Tax=Blepharisma stoltei TaxID=1481888 RepID=A0AAU9IBW3_9CILI|nr:unnamed protein product [Blepharisma stoltei]